MGWWVLKLLAPSSTECGKLHKLSLVFSRCMHNGSNELASPRVNKWRMWSPSTSEDILKSLGRHCVLDRCEAFIGDFILPQSWFMFRETELKRVTTLAPPHPVCVRYTERSHTVSSFSETDRLGALGVRIGTGIQGRVGII